MFGAEIESPRQKKNGPTAFFPSSRRGVSAAQLAELPRWDPSSRLAKVPSCGRAARLRHGISPECPSSRHIFLKNAARAKIILRFELSHKSGSNLFQNSTDFIDKERRAYYVLEHRMRTACVLFRSISDAPFFSVSANERECDMSDINNIASVCVACSCRETITGKKRSTLRRM